MQSSTVLSQKRIESIDIVRGIVMIIMALDHVRDYIYITANTDDPLNLATTTPGLFFTRWITHFCAPTFVFLSGTSIYLQSIRKTKNELSGFLLKRGLWLIFVECVIITFAWSYNPHYNFIFLQVIWTIGISMVFMSVLVRLPFRLILILGLVIVFGHDLLDYPEAVQGFKAGFVWDLFHHGFFVPYPVIPGHTILIIYPFLPWLGVMMLGYCAGKLFTPDFSPERRKKYLTSLGLGLLLFFVVLRLINQYGDPIPWTVQKNLLYTFFDFIKVNKYPPSILYLCITIGPMLLLLAWIEKIKNGFTDTMSIYGRVAFFYYVIHLYLVHFIASILFFTRGHTFEDATKMGSHLPFYFMATGEGYNLAIVYLVWAFVVISLYPLCKWYDTYKYYHREKWWLSYL